MCRSIRRAKDRFVRVLSSSGFAVLEVLSHVFSRDLAVGQRKDVHLGVLIYASNVFRSGGDLPLDLCRIHSVHPVVCGGVVLDLIPVGQ